MIALWRWWISFLVWLSADPQAVELEHPRAAAAVAAARTSMDARPSPEPKGSTVEKSADR